MCDEMCDSELQFPTKKTSRCAARFSPNRSCLPLMHCTSDVNDLNLKYRNQTCATVSSLHGDGFQVVVVGGTGFCFLFKPEAVVRLIPKIEVVGVVLRRVNRDDSPGGERNVDVKHAECETCNESR